MADEPTLRWQERFPPATRLRSYMMDVTASDVVPVPDLRRLLGAARNLPPLTSVAAGDWEPVTEGVSAPAPGMVIESFLTISPGVEIMEGGRTPCREEHLIVLACAGTERRSPVVVCPLVLAESLTSGRHPERGLETVERMRAGELRGVIPVLLPRAGYDAVANVFISLLQVQAAAYSHIAGTVATGRAPLRLCPAATGSLQSALYALVC